MTKSYWVYILASKPRGTLYVGVTNDLAFRVYEHKKGRASKFTNKYRVNRLVYAEEYEDIGEATAQEKRMKRWRRQWKIELIEKINPDWNDLHKSSHLAN